MISLDWVSDYIKLDCDLNQLAVKISEAGINVEKVETTNIKNLTIGQILEVTNHPDSDHLHICTVDVKDQILTIVCGASNVKPNLKVIVAKENAILPGNFVIKKSKIRGIKSCGMLCALYELGLEEKTEELYNKGITELNQDAPLGENPLKYLNLLDTSYELDIHKHRNNDCFYHIGFAYEIGAIINEKVTLPADDYKEQEDNIKNHFNLEIITDKCDFYTSKMVTNVTIKQSPDFIKRRLQIAGMRSINNVVDIANYVMLEYGQPLHFFDKDKLGNKITVKVANNESFTSLDNIDYTLNDDIVIANEKEVVCIAGIKGGTNVEVDNETKNILIESAIFDAISIRNTQSKLNLRSEASIRYGKGLNYEYTIKALNRACHLLEKYADAKILSGEVTYDKIKKLENQVTFTLDQINNMLGINIEQLKLEEILNKLDFKFTTKDKTYIVTIPKRRLDIENNINDIAEEVGRLYGYHNLQPTLPKVPTKRGMYIGDVKYRKAISFRLRSLGLDECKTYTLVSPKMAEMFGEEQITLPNPMSIDKSILRTSLIPSLLNVYEYNKKRKVSNINIYEISKTYNINREETSLITGLMSGDFLKTLSNNIKVDFYVIKGIVCDILNYLGFKNRYQFIATNTKSMHPTMTASILLDRKEIGIIGRIHPSINKDEIYIFELNLNELMKETKAIKYKEISKFPSISRDLAFVMPSKIQSNTIEEIIKKSASRLLTNLTVFDVYEMNENKSIAYSLTFNDNTKTLIDEEINSIMEKIINDVTTKSEAKLREI